MAFFSELPPHPAPNVSFGDRVPLDPAPESDCWVDAKKSIESISVSAIFAIRRTTTYSDNDHVDEEWIDETKTKTFRRRHLSDFRNAIKGDSAGFSLHYSGAGTYPTMTFTRLSNPQCRDKLSIAYGRMQEFSSATYGYPDGFFTETWQASSGVIDTFRLYDPFSEYDQSYWDALAVVKADWETHSVWIEGDFMLLCNPCCPCNIEIIQYPAFYPNGITTHTRTHGTNLEWDTELEEYVSVPFDISGSSPTSHFWLALPDLHVEHCKSDIKNRGGAEYLSTDNESIGDGRLSAATLTATQLVAGGPTTNAQIEIRVNQTGVPDISVDFLWVDANEVEYTFRLTTPNPPYGNQRYYGDKLPEIYLIECSDLPPVTDYYGSVDPKTDLTGVTGTHYSSVKKEYFDALDKISRDNFCLSVATKADREWGVWIIGFIGKYAKTAVSLPTQVATADYSENFTVLTGAYMDSTAETLLVRKSYAYTNAAGFSDHLRFYPEIEFNYGSIGPWTSPDYLSLGIDGIPHTKNPPRWGAETRPEDFNAHYNVNATFTKNVAKCMSDGGTSWSRTWDDTHNETILVGGSVEDGDAVYAYVETRRNGSMTYSW